MVELLEGTDDYVRGAKVKTGKTLTSIRSALEKQKKSVNVFKQIAK